MAFLAVYVREAHPSDEWQMQANESEGVLFKQPTTLPQRCDVASRCCETLSITMPMVVDSMDNAVDEMYAGWPERLYVIGADGRIAYAGGRGPMGFKPQDVQRWLERHLN